MRSLQHLFNFHVQLMIWTATVALTDLFWEMLASVTQPHLQRRCEMPTTTYGAGCRFCTQICTQSATVKYAAVKLVSLISANRNIASNALGTAPGTTCCNRVDNEHPETLARPFHLRPVTIGFGCRELVAIG
jgi:hypothetical protein